MSQERTLILLKPDAVQRRLVGDIIARIEAKGLQLVGMKLIQMTPEMSKQHYAAHVERPFYPNLEEFITSGPIVALAVGGLNAISVMRTLMGPTNGAEAAPGTIRGDYGLSRQMNLIHGSDSPEAAQTELALYFSDDELLDYDCTLDPWTCADDEA